MRVLQATNSLTRTGGGVPPVVWGLADGLARRGDNVSVYALADAFDREDWPAWRDASLTVRTFQRAGMASLGWSPALHTALQADEGGGRFDLVHQHGIWSLLSAGIRRWQVRWQRPCVVAPHGMLDPWALRYHPWRKRLFGALIEKRSLRSADCLHAVCEAELPGLRDFGLRQPVAVVPNGIRLAEFADLPSRRQADMLFPCLAGRRWILFLSRLHPKKGLPGLLRAWSGLARDFEDWSVVIAGPDQLEHRAELESLAAELNIADDVAFLGPVYGEQKKALLGGAEIFVLPSFSEGLGIAVLEAMAGGLPLLITPGCHLPEVEARGAGLLRQPNPESLADGLRVLMEQTDATRAALGRAAHRWAAEAFTVDRAAEQISAVYAWLLGRGDRPSCVAAS